MAMEMGDTLWFGKYKGATFAEVSRINPGYLQWALKSGAIRQNEMPVELTGELEVRQNEQALHEQTLAELYGSKDEPMEITKKIGDAPVGPFPARYYGIWHS